MKDAFPTRRGVLRGLGTLACSAAAHPLWTPMSFASVPSENRLVVIVLRGAMDGLDAVRPVGDPAFAALRPDLGATGHDLDGFFALHDGLSALMPLWRAGELSFAHAVSTPYRDGRSHFDGQDVLEAGVASVDAQRDVAGGWLNRLVADLPGARMETAFAVGHDPLDILAGSAPVARWSPDARLGLGQAAEQLLGRIYAGDPLFEAAAQDAIALSRGTTVDGGGPPELRAARFAADRLQGDTRIASFSVSGWDTHRRQRGTMAHRLERLADTILALREGLGPLWARTTVLGLTEFGRTARQNGTGGTDHGTGGAAILAGGALNGGRVHGRWPGLTEADLFERRDLMPTGDVRAYAGWVMRGLFGLSASRIEGTVFPGLLLGRDPGILA